MQKLALELDKQKRVKSKLSSSLVLRVLATGKDDFSAYTKDQYGQEIN
jgi:hypothetical protein